MSWISTRSWRVTSPASVSSTRSTGSPPTGSTSTRSGISSSPGRSWRIGASRRASSTTPRSADQVFSSRPHGLEVLELVRRRQRLLKDAWLTETGHKRPGMTPGLPLDEATRRAGEIGRQLHALLSPEP